MKIKNKILLLALSIIAMTGFFGFSVKNLYADPVYLLATDDDFEDANDYRGQFIKYIGTDEYVEIPLSIGGKSVTSYRRMFEGSAVKGVENSPENNVIDMRDMFLFSTATSLDVSGLHTSSVTDMDSMFYNSKATSLDVSKFDTSNVTNMFCMFMGSTATSLDVSDWDTSKVTNMGSMFHSSKATSLDVSKFDTSNVTDMGSMFSYVAATSLDVSKWDTSNVTDMSYMFYDSAATSLDVSDWNTSNVTNMRGMFYDSAATSLDVSKFDTSNVTDIGSMFSYAAATSLDVSKFDTSKATNMNGMFMNSATTSLDVSDWDTSNVTGMRAMFHSSKATSLDVAGFDTSKVTDMGYMFARVVSSDIDMTSFSTSSLEEAGSIIDNTDSSINFFMTQETKDKLISLGNNHKKEQMIVPIDIRFESSNEVREVHEVRVEALSPDPIHNSMFRYAWSESSIFDESNDWDEVPEESVVRGSAPDGFEGIMYLHLWAEDTEGRETKTVSTPYKFKHIDRKINIVLSNEEYTNEDVIVEVEYPLDSVIVEYNLGESGSWMHYTEPFTIWENMTIYARSFNQDMIQTEGSLAVANIDKIGPSMKARLK